MSKVWFMSRETFEVFHPNEPTAYISINGHGHSVPRTTPGLWVAGLAWYREDDSNPVPEREVKMLCSFVETWRDYAWVVHCAAGISRSAAVAHYISAVLDLPLVGLDSDGSGANTVIKAALMHHMWEVQFKEPYIDQYIKKGRI